MAENREKLLIAVTIVYFYDGCIPEPEPEEQPTLKTVQKRIFAYFI